MSVRDRGSPPVPHTARSALASLTGLLLAFVVGAAAIGCDPGHGVTFENRTSHTVTVFRDGIRDFELEPSERATYSIIEFTVAELIEARDESGRVVYSESLTWDELKERGWKIVITEAAPAGGSPTPEVPEPASPSPQ